MLAGCCVAQHYNSKKAMKIQPTDELSIFLDAHVNSPNNFDGSHYQSPYITRALRVIDRRKARWRSVLRLGHDNDNGQHILLAGPPSQVY